MRRISLLLLGSMAIASAAPAEDLGLRPGVSPRPRSAAECGSRAAVYAAGSVRIWVVRSGSILEDNPLRPLSPASLRVLQIVVNGRSATAMGPDFENLRQGGAPARIEEANGHPIAWESGLGNLPDRFRVVAEDGRVLLGPLTLQSCEEAPAVAAEKPLQPKRPARSSAPRSDENRPGLPRGAIPSGGGGGLSLPQP